MIRRVSSASFVGRREELAELSSLLEQASARQPTAAFVAGESGVGKTRLLAELEARARADGSLVLSGECVELGEGELPYAPLLGALRPLGADAIRDILGGQAADLAPLVPELRLGAAPLDVAGQTAVFEAMLGLLTRLGERQPVVLAIEDIHWADPSSRHFLSFLVRNLRDQRLLVVSTYRSDELHRRHPLRPLLAELERAPRARRIELPRFSQAEMLEQLSDILDSEPDSRFAERLYKRTEGNPLFTEELVASDSCTEGAIPASLQEALLVRIEGLSQPAQAAMRTAAVAGQRTPHVLLAAAAALPEDDLVAGLREAVAGHVLVAEPGGESYAFRHALIREAVYADLLPGERTKLHLKLGEALEQQGGSEAELAHHWYAAHELRCALSASVRAGSAAKGVYAYGEALDHFERALEIWSQVPSAEEHAGVDHVELLRLAALAAEVVGDTRAISLLDEALSELDVDADPIRAARLQERRGRYLWEEARWEEALAAYHGALELLPPGASRERALVLAAHARVESLSGHNVKAIEVANEAIAAAEEAGEKRALSSALNSLGLGLTGSGRPEEGIAAMRRALTVALDSDIGEDASRAYNNLADVLETAGKADEALEVLEEGRERIQGYGRTVRWLEIAQASLLIRLGRLAEADEILNGREVCTPAQTDLFEEFTNGVLAMRIGRVADGQAIFAEVQERTRNTPEPQWHAPLHAHMADMALWEGRLEDARSLVERGLTLIEGVDRTLKHTTLGVAGMATEAAIAGRARDLGDDAALAGARERGEALLALIRQAAERVGDGIPDARAHTLEADAHWADLTGSPEPHAWDAAAKARAEARQPWYEAWARVREAEAHMEAGEDRDAAAAALAQACELARPMGSQPLIEAAESLARRARLTLPDVVGQAMERPAAPTEPDAVQHLGLTPREREVLELLAEGRTNREIAETLYMSEKTASVHVSRILAKLDVKSRTQAAAVAHRLGIVAPVA